MKKSKFTSLILCLTLCLVMCVSIFAGCDLVSKDMAKYYAEPVAVLEYDGGEKLEITKKDLVYAVNNYGSYYMQNYGLSGEETVKQLLEMVINEKLTIRAAENILKTQNGGEVLTTKEKTYLWEMTYDAVKENIISYYNDLNGIKDDEDSSTTQDGQVSQTVYEKSFTLEQNADGTYKIVLTKTTTDEVNDHVYWSDADRDVTKQNDLEVLYNCIKQFLKNQPIYNQGFNKYFSEVKKSEEGMNLSTDQDSVFKREIQRIYEVLYDSFLINKYSELNQTDNSSVTIDNLLELYTSKVVNSYNKYVVEGASTYDDDILSDVSSVYYYKTTGTQYFYVSHILAKFSDEEQAIYDECQKVLNGTSTKYTIKEAEDKIEQLYANLTFPVREKNEDGVWVETGETKSVEQVMTELQNKLASAAGNEQLKAEYFDEFIYKYNEDEGIMNAERNYVIGVDYTTADTENGTSYTAHSQMVESFTNAAIELYNYGSAKVGDLYSQQIRSDYGIHIIVYEGKVENLFSGIDSNFKLTVSDIEVLNEARVKAGEEKTVLDELFDELNTDRYTLFESMNMEFLRSEVKITYYPDAYKDLYE